MAGSRTADVDRRGGRDAAGPGRRAHDLPATRLLLDLDNSHAVRGLRLAHFGRGPGLHAVGEQQALVDILVIHHQQARSRAVLREVMDAIVVQTELRLLLHGAVRGIELECRVVSRQAHRLTPGGNDLRVVALWHAHRIFGGYRHALESEQGYRARTRRGTARERRHARQRRQQCRCQRTEPAAQHRAPGGRREFEQVWVGGAVAVPHGREVLGHVRVFSVDRPGSLTDECDTAMYAAVPERGYRCPLRRPMRGIGAA
jgi:hypothetical protein